MKFGSLFAVQVLAVVTAALGHLGSILSHGYELPKVENCFPEGELFQPFHSYPSRYFTSGRGSSSSVANQVFGFNMTCDLTVYAAGGCRYSMKVKDCVRKDEGQTKDSNLPYGHLDYFILDTVRHPVLFSMSNGKVEKLMVHQDEPTHVLNFKRGIISSILMKNSSESVQQDGHQKFQLRTDVQGTCPTQYRKSGSVITLTKKMADCDFPEKVDWSHSPWSLLWNMSFIQKSAIESTVHCQYSKELLLPSVKCAEEHMMRLRLTNDTGSDFQTVLTQEFIALEAKPWTEPPEVFDEGHFRLVDIRYEHERHETPVSNPEDLEKSAISLLEDLVKLPDEPIDPVTMSYNFEKLVDLLRGSADLKDMSWRMSVPRCLGSKKCQSYPVSIMGLNDFNMQMAQTWRDALVQCNRLPCFKGLLEMMHTNKGISSEDIITTNFLNTVYLSWVNLNIPSIDFFPEMLNMCKRRPTRPCLLSLTSVAHGFWHRKKDTLLHGLPAVFRDIAMHISSPIGSNCSNQTATREEIMVALVGIANLGEVAEVALEDLPERLHACATNSQLYWPINILAIQAQWRFRPTDALRQRLLGIFRNPAFRPDFRVAAYEILWKNWGDERLVAEVVAILNDDVDNFNLKTFLVSSLKAVAKSREPSTERYAEAIRATMDRNPEGFRLRTDRYVSKHMERHFHFSAPLPDQPEDGFGYRFSQTILHNPETFLPYSLTNALQVELFGKTFDLYEVYGNSRGMMKSYEVFLSYFFNMDKLDMTEAAQSVVKLLNIVVGRQKKPELINRFPYPVDATIFQNLLRIRKDRMASLAEAFSGEHAAIFKLKLLGDVLGFSTSDLLQEDIYSLIESWIDPYFGTCHQPISTSRHKILEAAHHVPTLAGLPLKWTLDALLELTLKRYKCAERLNSDYAIGFNFSSLATLRARMLLDFPKQTCFGVEALSSSSSSFGAILRFSHSFVEKSMNISLEFPELPLTWLSLTRENIVFQKLTDHHEYTPPSYDDEWCHSGLLPHIGTQWCHFTRRFRQRGRRANRQWYFVGQSENWNLITDLDQSHHRTFELNLDFNRGADVSAENFGINLRAIDSSIPNKFTDIATYRHDWHKGRDEHRIEIGIPKIPHLNLTVVKRPTDLGFELLASATILPNRTFAIHYLAKQTQEQGSEAALHHRPTSGSRATITLPVKYHVINITTPTEYYSWTYSHRRYPHTFVADLEFRCHSFLLQNAQWLQQLAATDSEVQLQTLELYFHHESQYMTDNLTLTNLPHLSYSYLKAPSSLLELDTFTGSLPTDAWAFRFNLTQRHLPSNKLVTFLKFGTTAEVRKKDVAGLETRVYDARVSVPDCSLVAGMEFRRASGKEFEGTLFIHKKAEDHQPSTWMLNKTDPILLEIRFSQSTSKASNAQQLKYAILANLTYGPEITVAQAVLEHAKDYTMITHRSFLESSALNLRWEATVDVDLTIPKITALGRILRAPQGDALVTYRAALTLPPDYTLGFQSSLDSAWYSSTSRLIYQASHEKGVSLDVHARANSSIWGLGNMTLEHTMTENTARTKFENQLLEYSFQGNWTTLGRGTFQIKSKNLEYVPNVVGTAEYAPFKGGFLQLSLQDVPRDVFLVYEMSPLFTERTFKLCFDKQCKNATSNPGTFLGKLLFTVVEKKNLATTLTYNKQFGKLIKPLIRARFGTKKKDSNALSYVNGGLRPGEVTIGQLLGPTLDSLQQEAGKIFWGFSCISESLAPIHDQIFGTMSRVGSYALTESSLAKLLQSTRLQHLYHHHDMNRRLSHWISLGISKLALGIFSVPAGRSENIYSFTVPLPMIRWRFGTLPSRANPAFHRLLRAIWPPTSDPAGRHFRSSRYTRFALFVGQGNVYTFDGYPLHLEQALSPQCAYLLSHDFELQRFTIYYQDQKFHFLLVDTRLTLAQGGEVVVNGTLASLPLEHWNGEFQVRRRENLVELDTKYNLKVTCDVDAGFCVFYTNVWKFNQLIGLLGNNNDNPGDDVKGLTDNRLFKSNYCLTGTTSHLGEFELTGSDQCSRKEEDLNDVLYMKKVCNTFEDISWISGSHHSPTFLCHDIIPNDNFRYPCNYCSRSACATVKAYLALCGAHAVSVDLAPVSCDKCNGHERGTEWTAEVTDKVEVVFLVDQGQVHRKIAKGLGILASSIDTKFTEFGYSSVRFGIVGFRGRGFRSGPEQHTLNSKLLGNVVEFSLYGLKSLDFTRSQDGDGSMPFDAITHAANHYSMDPRAHHVFILVTNTDSKDIIYAKAMHRAQKAMAAHQVALYVFSSYNSTAKWLSRFSATSGPDGADFTEGQYSRLANATRGALWPVSHLEKGSQQQQLYLDAVAEDMLVRGKQEVGRCRKCVCAAPSYHQVRALCRETPCTALIAEG